MNPKPLILIFLFIISGIFYYNLTDTKTLQEAQVERIIDGDTIQLTNNKTIRLLGINTPEKNQPYYQEAKTYLTNLIENKTILVESHDQDKYSRTLAHAFLDSKNINAQILVNGLATLYYYDKDSHYQELMEAEEFARENKLGLWKPSPNFGCIQITEFKTDEPESLSLQNTCNFQLNISYKDDANHIYTTTISPNSQYTREFSHIWNTEGDSIYVRDQEGLLLFYRY